MSRISGFLVLLVLSFMTAPVPAHADDSEHIIKMELHSLNYDKDARKRYPFLENDLESKAYMQYDPSGEKIALYEAIVLSRFLDMTFYFIYNSSGSAYCGKLGCSFDGYVKSGKTYTNVISTTTFTDIYFKDCPKEQSLLLGGPDGYSEWRFNGHNFEMKKAYRKFFQVAYCGS